MKQPKNRDCHSSYLLSDPGVEAFNGRVWQVEVAAQRNLHTAVDYATHDAELINDGHGAVIAGETGLAP
eukprot:3414987-Amphidinium_carterae.3